MLLKGTHTHTHTLPMLIWLPRQPVVPAVLGKMVQSHNNTVCTTTARQGIDSSQTRGERAGSE